MLKKIPHRSILFLLFSLLLISKNILFHEYMFGDFSQSVFWQYFAAEVSIAVLIASWVYISRSVWWTIAVSVVVDVWIIANWMYYQAYGLFVSVSMIGMAGNLHGFGDSLAGLWDARLLWFVLPTVVYSAIAVYLRDPGKRQWWPMAIGMVVGVGLVMLNNSLIHAQRIAYGYDDGDLTMAKMLPLYMNEKRMLQDWDCEYSLMREHSVIGYLPLHMAYELRLRQIKGQASEELTAQEKEWLRQIYSPSQAEFSPNSHLVLILVESLEAWTFYYPGITPRMNALRENSHVLFADKLSAQTRYGASGDGQLTFNTGLLPIQTGVACILYGENSYPNIAHCYPRSVVVNPSKGTWNQHVVTYKYGYQGLEEPESMDVATWWNDADVFAKTADWLAKSDKMSCVQAITVSSHTPFDRVEGEVPSITPDTPDEMRRYLTCIHYTDSCIGVLLDTLMAKGLMENTTVVISGDHNIFYGEGRKALVPYAQAHHLPITEDDRYLPLIVYSPRIDHPVYVGEETYQMDIYPTVMHAIGCDAYAWKGLGVNLLDPDARNHRLMSQDEAYGLSDKLIRSNWFEQHIN